MEVNHDCHDGFHEVQRTNGRAPSWTNFSNDGKLIRTSQSHLGIAQRDYRKVRIRQTKANNVWLRSFFNID